MNISPISMQKIQVQNYEQNKPYYGMLNSTNSGDTVSFSGVLKAPKKDSILKHLKKVNPKFEKNVRIPNKKQLKKDVKPFLTEHIRLFKEGDEILSHALEETNKIRKAIPEILEENGLPFDYNYSSDYVVLKDNLGNVLKKYMQQHPDKVEKVGGNHYILTFTSEKKPDAILKISYHDSPDTSNIGIERYIDKSVEYVAESRNTWDIERIILKKYGDIELRTKDVIEYLERGEMEKLPEFTIYDPKNQVTYHGHGRTESMYRENAEAHNYRNRIELNVSPGESRMYRLDDDGKPESVLITKRQKGIESKIDMKL